MATLKQSALPSFQLSAQSNVSQYLKKCKLASDPSVDIYNDDIILKCGVGLFLLQEWVYHPITRGPAYTSS